MDRLHWCLLKVQGGTFRDQTSAQESFLIWNLQSGNVRNTILLRIYAEMHSSSDFSLKCFENAFPQRKSIYFVSTCFVFVLCIHRGLHWGYIWRKNVCESLHMRTKVWGSWKIPVYKDFIKDCPGAYSPVSYQQNRWKHMFLSIQYTSHAPYGLQMCVTTNGILRSYVVITNGI